MKKFDTDAFRDKKAAEQKRIYNEAYEAEIRKRIEEEVRSELETKAREDASRAFEAEKTKDNLLDEAVSLGIGARSTLAKQRKDELEKLIEEAKNA